MKGGREGWMDGWMEGGKYQMKGGRVGGRREREGAEGGVEGWSAETQALPIVVCWRGDKWGVCKRWAESQMIQ